MLVLLSLIQIEVCLCRWLWWEQTVVFPDSGMKVDDRVPSVKQMLPLPGNPLVLKPTSEFLEPRAGVRISALSGLLEEQAPY